MKLNELKTRVQKLYSSKFSKEECAIISDAWAILESEKESLQSELLAVDEKCRKLTLNLTAQEELTKEGVDRILELEKELSVVEEENDKLREGIQDFLSYFELRGGISGVPLGLFERTKYLLNSGCAG